MNCYVIDTNLFFNMEAGFSLGKNTEEVMKNITKAAGDGKKSGSFSLYMPPRIVDEFLSFFDNKEQDSIKNLLSQIIIKSPNIHDAKLSAQLFYTLIEDIRQRSYRGLRIGEEEIDAAAKKMMGQPPMEKVAYQKTVGEYIRGYRDRYRQATRVGFLDSIADLDIIMLALELNGTVVSSDEGLLKWARLFGVKEVLPQAFSLHLHLE